MGQHEGDAGIAVLHEQARVSKALAPLRLEILRKLSRPNSATGVAHELGFARQKVNYHLRELERLGLIRLVEERQRRGFVERRFQAVARAFIIDPSMLGMEDLASQTERSDSEVLSDRFSSAHLIGLAARLIRELAALRDKARRAKKRLLTLNLETEIAFRSPAEFSRFREELADEVARLAAKYESGDQKGSHAFRMVVGVHPVLKKKNQ